MFSYETGLQKKSNFALVCYTKRGDYMRKANLLLMLGIFSVLAIVFVILEQTMFFYASATLVFVIGIMLVSRVLIDKKYQKKLDKRYQLLTRDNLEKEFEKVRKTKEEDKIKAFCLVHFSFLENYEDKIIEEFGKYLKTKFAIDPMGYVDGIAVIVINMHEIMMNEMFKIIKKELNDKNFNLKYKVGMSFYTNNDSLESLLSEAKRGAKL